MQTIKSIFNNKIFRIPDYQRGYSWEKNNLDDFWQDLNNLQHKKVHYTGMISVEEVSEEEYMNWSDDKWIITGKGEKPYFIVDGQQRITTIIILIWVICQKMPEGSQINFSSKEEIINKYIFTENKQRQEKSYLFGYHRDNPSYEFLKREIFEQNDYSNNDIEETVYTNNLLNAKLYFIEKVKKMSLNDLEILFSKLTQQLKFDFKELEKELDIFIVFETMNNRGKPLSNLEKLKNRLIYLSTLLKDESIERKVDLRDKINESWKTIYKYLGLNKERKLDDDAFLQNHWIMYKRYDRREPEFYANDVFDRFFTSHNVLNGKEDYESIQRYIRSLTEGVKQWFLMNSPKHPQANEICQSKIVINWLMKLNQLGFKSFAPLIMGALVTEKDKDKTIKLLQLVESYIFLIFSVSFRRSNTGTYHFYAKASELYNSEIEIEDIIKDLELWIYGKQDYNGYYEISGFYSFLRDLFLRENGKGFYDWKFLRYFLYEYDIDIAKKNNLEYDSYDDLNSVQHIFPEKPLLLCWKKMEVQDFSYQEIKSITGSLGNFVLLRKNVHEQDCFIDKLSTYKNYNNAKNIIDLNEWNEKTILNRGLELLDFMEKRWNITIGSKEDKIKLLFLDFVES
ncbi:DUF262 domain-containing protein [Chryseobacterium caseinilyticum]|uniref:DUF262 domain-containing protein n=1 Tax=Chryseobacterium caseinilyticum TaxID=2771428 RepID=A0ABR8ZF10_9FLAO|nr:DUF262 domain-containing protein [Chryseobacterium caseinilyticum]MBD8083865.1 DUF262 domain-containing protein [Chryseobacterium caseinilyticum]